MHSLIQFAPAFKEVIRPPWIGYFSFFIVHTCIDGIHNQGEDGIDCGGPCKACPTCIDGIQNQDETGIDCGGSCGACSTCNDEIQNQGENGIDCGGPCDNDCSKKTTSL